MTFLLTIVRDDAGLSVLWTFLIGTIWLVFRLFRSAAGAPTSKGSDGHSSDGSAPRGGNLDVKVERHHESVSSGLALYVVQMKASRALHPGLPGFITAVTSLLDVTEGDGPDDAMPVYSLIEEVQEPLSFAFKHVQGPTAVGNSFSMNGHAAVTILSPTFLACPKPGKRKIRVIVRMFANFDSHDSISMGRFNGTCLAAGTVDWWIEETSPGYLEHERRQSETLDVAVWIGMAVAAADGSIGEDELRTIKEWLKAQLDRSIDQDIPQLRQRIHTSMRTAFEAAQCGEIAESDVAARLRGLGDEDLQVRAMTLGYRVLAADGEADPGELSILESLARKAGIDRSVLERIKDTTLVGVNTVGGDGLEDLPGLLGFDPDDDPATIRKHLRNEHRKWNARSANAKTKEDRERVELMLNCIARALREYAS
jgi:tellurite resistance protein